MSKHRAKITDRITALLLTVILLCSLLPASALAVGENEVTISVNGSEGALEGALVNYTINTDADSSSSMSASTDADGVATIDMSSYVDAVADEAQEVNITYTVSKEGYTTSAEQTERITGLGGNVGTVTLTEAETGGPEEDGGNDEPTVNSYPVTVDAGTDGVVTLSVDGVEIQSGDEVENGKTVDITVAPNNGYAISSVKVDNAEQIADSGLASSWAGSVEIAGGAIAINVAFVQVYSVTVNFSENGDVTVDGNPITAGGTVTYQASTETFTVEAVPKENYRVASVSINNVADENAGTSNSLKYSKDLTADQDYTVEITFALNQFEVSASISGQGTVTFGDDNTATVDYGGSVSATIEPEDGYVIDEVNGARVSAEKSVGYTQKIENITENTKIEVSFVKVAEITLTPESANKNGFYNKDVSIGVSVPYVRNSDGAVISAVISYKSSDGTTVSAAAPVENNAVVVDADTYNNKDVTVTVTVTDSVGRTISETTETIKIRATAPEMSIEWEGDKSRDAAEGEYYNAARTATVTITEATNDVFDGAAALAALNIPSGATATEWVKADGKNTYSAVVTFSGDGNYDWALGAYENLAGVSSDEIEPCKFCVDTETTEEFKLSGELKATSGSWENTWTEIVETITFGLWRNKEVTLSAQAADGCSGVQKVEYVRFDTGKDETTAGKSYAELETVADWILWTSDSEGNYTGLTVAPDAKFAVYVKVTDNAGNHIYISTDGIITEDNPGNVTLDIPTPNGNNYYNNTVEIGVTVTEDTEQIYSGIASVTYQVGIDSNRDGIFDDENSVMTTVAYEYEDGDLLTTWDQNTEGYQAVVVDPEKGCNDDNVLVVVTATDLAGNVFDGRTYLSINSDTPKVSIAFNDAVVQPVTLSEDGYGYYDAGRTATITIENKDTVFDAESAAQAIAIKAEDANGNVLSEAIPTITADQWKTASDNTYIHTLIIPFEASANYTLSFGTYTSKSDMSNEGVTIVGGTVSPYAFTVDLESEPTGKIAIGEKNIWETLLTKLTFGLYTPDEFTVRVSDIADEICVTDAITVEYCKVTYPQKDENEAAVEPYVFTSDEDLTQLEFEKVDDWDNVVTVNADEQFVVYLKLTDYAGHVTYLCTDGAIVDTAMNQPEVTVSESTPASGTHGEAPVYNGDVAVDVSVSDIDENGSYSGIKSISYTVECGTLNDGVVSYETTQSGELYSFGYDGNYQYDEETSDSNAPKYSDLRAEWSKEQAIVVDSGKNNSCYVRVTVKVEDNAGNVSETTLDLDIDITAPTIAVSYNNNTARNDKYFDAARTATVVITERTNHFDAAAATEGITITAVDAKGKQVTLPEISDWTTVEGETADEATHTATIPYNADANYTFAIMYTDQAANANTPVDYGASIVPTEFTVDKNDPTGTIQAVSAEGRTTVWDALVSNLTFGYWSGRQIVVTNTAEDETSPIESVEYYKTDSATALSAEELVKVLWTPFNGLTETANQQFSVYLKITDCAGNITYISTDGMIVDDTAPREEVIAPEITVTPEQPINGFYNRDVSVSIQVTDPTAGDTFSGLKEVSYRVLNMGEETQSGVLYSFTNTSPARGDLLQTWTGAITVDSELNNSNDVVIEVSAVDNAGNTSSDQVAIQIDVTAPAINITYNNNSPDSSSYYKADRVATIVVTERNFNPDDVIVTITNTDGTIPSISGWSESIGGGNGDTTTHTATITYHADGDYTFTIGYTDLANNICSGETYSAGTTNPTEFTIDQTNPTITVSYDNNTAVNGKYFNANRTATVTVVEHNFDVSRVTFTQTASLSGASIDVPSASWSNSGDTHTATIVYNADGDYTFEVTMTDMAGNESGAANYGNSVAGTDFTIDTTWDEIVTVEGIADGEVLGLENGVIDPDAEIKITFSDINFSSYGIILTRSRILMDYDNVANSIIENDMDVTDQFIRNATGTANGTVTFSIPKDDEDGVSNDGLYVLRISAEDQAGNAYDTDANEIVFSVNRYGSVYVFNDALFNLAKDGGAYVQSVEDTLVISEYNPNALTEANAEITKDAAALDSIALSTEVLDTEIHASAKSWYEYTYSFEAANFAEDGVYRISVASQDAAKHNPESLNYAQCEVLFRVDSTAPEISSIVGLENAIVNAENLEFTYDIFDAIGLKQVTVYVNEQKAQMIDEFDNLINYSNSYTLTEGANQKIRLVVEDLAGNVTDTDAQDGDGNYLFAPGFTFKRDVTVSTNFFIRWYANKPVFWGCVGGAVVAAGLIVFLIIFARKRKKNEEEKSAGAGVKG